MAGALYDVNVQVSVGRCKADTSGQRVLSKWTIPLLGRDVELLSIAEDGPVRGRDAGLVRTLEC